MPHGAVIVAAGRGFRMGGEVPKQFMNLLDRPVVVHTVQRIIQANLFKEIVVVVPPGKLEFAREEVFRPHSILDSLLLIEGSALRQESVYLGLQHLSEKVEIACIHDGVRPLTSQTLIKEVFWSAELHGASVPVIPLKDTLKEVNSKGEVVRTVPRENFRLTQTPQCFSRELLMRAHQFACEEGVEATDDASLVEMRGNQVKVIPGTGYNIKITTPEDLLMAEFILRTSGEHV